MAPDLSTITENFEQFLTTLPKDIVNRGRNIHKRGEETIEQINARQATLRVYLSGYRFYRVTILIENGKLAFQCPCSREKPNEPCPHIVAALFKLYDYITENPIVPWRDALDPITRAQQPTMHRSQQRHFLLVSLQFDKNGWHFVPYTLARHLVDNVHTYDNASLVETIRARGLSSEAKVMRNRISGHGRSRTPVEAIAAANMLVALRKQFGMDQSNNYRYYYYYNTYQTNPDYSPVFPLLPHCLIFLGEESNPLRDPIEVLPGTGNLVLSLEEASETLHITVLLHHNEEVIDLAEQDTILISEEPLCLLIDNTLVQVEENMPGIIDLLNSIPLEVPASHRTEFLDHYLLPLTERIQVEGAMIAWEEVDEEPVPRLYLGEKEGELHAHLRFGYGEFEVLPERRPSSFGIARIPDSTTFGRITRRAEKEEQLWKSVSNYGLKRGKPHGWFLLRANVHTLHFLLHHVPRLAEAGFEVYGEEEITAARVNRNRPTISFNITSGIDWFDVEAVVNFGELEVSLKDIRRAMRRKQSYIKLSDGSIGMLPEEWFERYRHLFAVGEETEEGLRLSQGHFTLLDQLLEQADHARADDEFRQHIDHLRAFSSISTRDLPDNFQGTLRPYQKAGYDWLHFLHDYRFGGCLADDMGTGKTVQALAFLASLRANGHATAADLVIMPRSLLFNWQREAERFTPHLRVYIQADHGRIQDAREFGDYDLVLTTYGTMLRDIELLRGYTFHYLVLDESQAIKNPLAETSKAARLLRGEHRLALTGTPVENTTLELWSQFAFLNPGLLGNLDYYRQEFATPIERGQDGDRATFLRRMVYPFILRRTKEQVEPDLPPRTERILETDMEPKQRKLYTKQRDYYRALLLGMIDDEGIDSARMKILEGLLRLRQICNHPRLVEPGFKGKSGKFEMLLETLETLRAEGQRVLVFSQFVQMLSLVREELDRRAIPYAYLDGQTRNRQQEVDRFQSAEGPPFFLISLKAGGVGLNLTAASYVVHIDPWWNPAVERQATDRTHRIGQEKPVFVYRLVARDSVEEKILQLQERKRALVEQIISTEGGGIKALTREDIEVLFG